MNKVISAIIILILFLMGMNTYLLMEIDKLKNQDRIILQRLND